MPKKEKIRQMFDTIASDYDFLNHLMSLGVDRGWRRKALKAIVPAQIPAGFKVLDVACGTGDFSLAIARALAVAEEASVGQKRVLAARSESAPLRKCPPEASSATAASVLGVDLSEGMLEVMRVGVRNFENRPRGLEEMLRVLKPGGRLVILELSVPSNRILRACYNLYFVHLLPWIGGLVSGDKAAYRYLPASVLAFPGRDAFTAELIRAGFVDVRHRALTLGLCRMYVAFRKTC